MKTELVWINDYSKETIQGFRESEYANETKESVKKYYDFFLTQKERDKFEPIKLNKEVTIKDIDILITNSRNLMKNIWIKNRYPEYYSKQWGYLSILFHIEWSNLLFLKEIKERKRPLSNLIHIFQY